MKSNSEWAARRAKRLRDQAIRNDEFGKAAVWERIAVRRAAASSGFTRLSEAAPQGPTPSNDLLMDVSAAESGVQSEDLSDAPTLEDNPPNLHSSAESDPSIPPSREADLP